MWECVLSIDSIRDILIKKHNKSKSEHLKRFTESLSSPIYLASSLIEELKLSTKAVSIYPPHEF